MICYKVCTVTKNLIMGSLRVFDNIIVKLNWGLYYKKIIINRCRNDEENADLQCIIFEVIKGEVRLDTASVHQFL